MNTITTKDGTQIFFKEWGTGQPVVFCHGWPLNSDSSESQMLFLASKGYRCIAHDRRGHGRPSQPSDGNEMNTYADDLAELLNQAGEVQRVSAGTGIEHSEFNNSPTDQVHFLQIWLVPKRKGLTPSYAQASFAAAPLDALTLACSANGGNGSIKINQDVSLYVGKLSPKGKISKPLEEQRHVWVQLIEGDLDLNGKKLSLGDVASLDDEREVRLASAKGAHFLLFDLN
jgi:hypothetical protein